MAQTSELFYGPRTVSVFKRTNLICFPKDNESDTLPEKENNNRCVLISDRLLRRTSVRLPPARCHPCARGAHPWHRHLSPLLRSIPFPCPAPRLQVQSPPSANAEHNRPSRWHLPPRSHGHGAARTACAGCLPPPRALRHRGGSGSSAARGGGASAAIALLQPDSGMTG